MSRTSAFILLIVTAFLTMQWSSAHIHLSEHHDHDGGHHQHLSKAHSHSLGNHHADVVDASHVDGHDRVVELDREYTPPKSNKLDGQSNLLIPAKFNIGNIARNPTSKCITAFNPPGSSWLAYSHKQPRAPPLISLL